MSLNLRGARAEDRATREDYEPYTDPNVLDIPKFGDEAEFVYRWLRVEQKGQVDVKNIRYRKQQGWEFVKEETLPDDFRALYTANPMKEEVTELDGVVRNGDLVLGKWPRRKALGYQKWVKDQSDLMARRYDAKRVSEQLDNEGTVVMDNEGSNQVVRGRVPHFSKS